MLWTRFKFLASLILLLFNCWTLTSAQTISIKTDSSKANSLHNFRQQYWDNLPTPVGSTNDFEHLFTDVQVKSLDSIIDNFKEQTTIQICIITIDSMCVSDDKFDDLSLHFANTWGVGMKYIDNGITICFSRGRRKIRISNGYGIEAILSDQETKAIVDNDFIPSFKEGDYYKGAVDGLMAIISKLNTNIKIR